jgi:hypothetical protein
MKKTVQLDPVTEVADLAFGMLVADADNPDVGMGLFASTAVREAMKRLNKRFGADFCAGLSEQAITKNVIARAAKARLPGYSR